MKKIAFHPLVLIAVILLTAAFAYFLGGQKMAETDVSDIPSPAPQKVVEEKVEPSQMIASETSSLPKNKPVKNEEEFGNWVFECVEMPDAGQKACRLLQKHWTNANGKKVSIMTVSVGMMPRVVGEDKKLVNVPTLIFSTPLNSALAKPVIIGFGQKDEKLLIAPYQTCNAAGCIAERLASEKLVNDMKDSEKMIVAYQLLTVEGPKTITLDVSLKGFTDAFDALVEHETQAAHQADDKIQNHTQENMSE